MNEGIKELAVSKLYSYIALFLYMIGIGLVAVDYIIVGVVTIVVAVVFVLASVITEAIFMCKVLFKK